MLSRLLLPAVLALGALALQPAPGAETPRRTIAMAIDPGPDAAPPPVTVLEQGAPRPLLGYDRIDPARTPWRIVVYVDLPLSSQLGLEHSARLLLETVPRLVALGDVDVVVARASATSSLEMPERRDPEAVAAALEGLVDLEAGELEARRARTVQLLAAAENDAERKRIARDHLYEEEELRAWQQHALEDYLFGVVEDEEPRARPRALLLLRDALEPSATDALERLVAQSAAPAATFLAEASAEVATAIGPRADADRQRRFARTAAALGWIVDPLRRAGDEAPLAREIAEATSGAIISDAGTLDAAIASLERRWRITFETAHDTGAPVPVDVRALTGAAQVRAPRWGSAVLPEALAEIRARRLVEDDVRGNLPVVAALVGEAAGSATLEAAIRSSDLTARDAPRTSDRLRVTTIRRRLDRDDEIEHHRGSGLELSGSGWILRTPVATPDDLRDVVVVAEDLASGRWGATFAEPADESLAALEPTAIVETTDVEPPPVPHTAPERARVSQNERAPEDDRSLVGEPRQQRPARPFPALQLIPPRGRDLVGEQKFETLLSLDAVRRVEFYLDGQLVADDADRPFSARIDLGAAARRHEVRAVAYSRDDLLLGEDTLIVNPPRREPGIRFTRVEAQPGSRNVEVEAELQLAKDQALDRVELYRNEQLIATLTEPPYRATLPGPGRADADYVRAVAHLRGGGFLEDVRLLGSAAVASESIQVNLVEVYAVVTDERGNVVDGLSADDFTVELEKRPVRIERFAIADEVPLDVGLVIDTSTSMWTLMPDTRSAASRFLGQVLRPSDRGFLVDFADRPRLAHDLTGDVFALMRSVGRLQAGGNTALYDSVVFALLQFDEEVTGRRAVVVLTDGEDYNSRFSYRRTHRTAARAGLPVYFIALGGLHSERPSFRKDDIELIADVSGGRVFYVEEMSDVYAAYDQISRELRSQYVLAFTTPERLGDEQLSKVRVEVSGAKRTVRYAVGRR